MDWYVCHDVTIAYHTLGLPQASVYAVVLVGAPWNVMVRVVPRVGYHHIVVAGHLKEFCIPTPKKTCGKTYTCLII